MSDFISDIGIPGLGAVSGLVGSVLNYSNASKALKWQKSQWEQVKQREDTAVQRRVADLKAAGINPVLAAGSAATAQAAPAIKPPQFEGNPALDYITMQQARANIAHTRAQAEYNRKQTELADEHLASAREDTVHKKLANRIAAQQATSGKVFYDTDHIRASTEKIHDDILTGIKQRSNIDDQMISRDLERSLTRGNIDLNKLMQTKLGEEVLTEIARRNHVTLNYARDVIKYHGEKHDYRFNFEGGGAHDPRSVAGKLYRDWSIFFNNLLRGIKDDIKGIYEDFRFPGRER